jgi:hypothetical protein
VKPVVKPNYLCFLINEFPMPRKPQVHFRLKPEDKNGESLIYLQFIYDRNRLFYSFGQSINPKDLNSNKQRVKKKDVTTEDGKN